jgi:hypothetical protein
MEVGGMYPANNPKGINLHYMLHASTGHQILHMHSRTAEWPPEGHKHFK